MQGYNPDFHGHHRPVAQHSGSLLDRASPSVSDEDAYLLYPEPHKMEPVLDDDPNAALTSQTLNADGTPKRPMNAFMIFARRRRPQVAAENQSMRTGEVSKILSREWNAMSLSDKQFYLDQAKILKDNFNQKYPDYVYKRRPNNSRRRRKPDSSGPSAEHASSSDLVDDYSGSTDYNDVSPVDVAETDDSHITGQDSRYASLPVDSSSGTYPTSQTRASSYQPHEAPYRPLGDTRISYMSRPDRTTPDTSMTPSIAPAFRGSEHSASYYHPHPYLPTQHHHHIQSSPYYSESGSSAEAWSRDDQSRMQVQSWSQSTQGLGEDNRHRGYHQAVSSHGVWANASGSEAIPSANSSGASTTNYNLPTLNSPFYPPQSSAQESFSSSSVHSVSVSPQHYGVPGRSYPSLQQPFSSGSSPAISSYQPQARAVSITLPSGQPVPYPHAQPTSTPPPAGSGGEASHMRYWPREK